MTVMKSVYTEESEQEQCSCLLDSKDDGGGKPGAIMQAPQDVPDMSSVITQVTKEDWQQQQHLQHSGAGGHASAAFHVHGPPLLKGAHSWRSKVKQLLCCFAPGSGYQRDGALAGQPLGSGRLLAYPPLPPTIQRPAQALIGPKHLEDAHKKTLVLDLDETLVHSSFKPIPSPDYVLPVEIDGKLVDVYVLKRPWLDHFMEVVGSRYEVVVFTASLSKYADPLLDLLDKWKVVKWRLFRESCVPYEGNYVKDLASLGRELQDIIIVDNSPHSYALQPDNALPIGTFIDDLEDQQLLELLPVLQQTEAAADVRGVLAQYVRPEQRL